MCSWLSLQPYLVLLSWTFCVLQLRPVFCYSYWSFLFLPYGLCTSSFCVECPHFVWLLPTCLQFNCHPLREISLTFLSQIYSYSTRSLSLPTLIIILPFNKSLQSAQYVSGTILGTWDITVNKTKSLSSWSFYSDKRKKAINKHITM